MRASCLILKTAGDKLLAVASEKNSELLALASEIRKSGQHDGEPVKAGIILAHDRPFPVSEFSCTPSTVKAKKK
jgi:hypothetical protein